MAIRPGGAGRHEHRKWEIRVGGLKWDPKNPKVWMNLIICIVLLIVLVLIFVFAQMMSLAMGPDCWVCDLSIRDWDWDIFAVGGTYCHNDCVPPSIVAQQETWGICLHCREGFEAGDSYIDMQRGVYLHKECQVYLSETYVNDNFSGILVDIWRALFR